VIPTLVVVLNATAYDPEEDEEGVTPDEDGETPGVEGEVEVDTGRRHPRPTLGLLGIDATRRQTRVTLGVPAVEVRPVYSAHDLVQYGQEQETEVRIPIVRGSF
jgi:hypothetical protein